MKIMMYLCISVKNDIDPFRLHQTKEFFTAKETQQNKKTSY